MKKRNFLKLAMLSAAVILFILMGCKRDETSNKNDGIEEESNQSSATEDMQYVNSPNGLRVRSEPDLDSEILALLSNKAEVQIIQVDTEAVVIDQITGHWSLIKSGEIQGWVFGGYLEKNLDTIYDIYIAGSFAGEKGPLACYWKNDQRTYLSVPEKAQSSCAEEIIFSGDSLYITGKYSNSEYSMPQPCYWKDGIRVDLPVSGISMGKVYISVKNNQDVYVSASIEHEMSSSFIIWKNGQALSPDSYPLDHQYEYSRNGFQIIEGKEYYTGVEIDRSIPENAFIYAIYWENGKRFSLRDPLLKGENSSYPSKVFKSKNNIYVLGSYYNGLNRDGIYFYTGCYWSNGKRTDLESEMYHSIDNQDITVLDGKVFCAGFDSLLIHENNYISQKNVEACYWENGKYIDIHPEGAQKSVASSIASKSKDFIIAGWYNYQNDEFSEEEGDRACYWINGINRVDLSGLHAEGVYLK